MKKLLIMIFLSMPLISMAQNGWERVPTEEEVEEQTYKARKAAKKAAKKARKAAKAGKTLTAGQDSIVNLFANEMSAADAKKLKKETQYKKYVQPGVVPENDGKVIFTLDIDVPGKNAQQIYDKMYTMLDDLAKGENQKSSGIVLINKEKHVIAAKYSEWLVFTKNFFVLDRTEFNYTIIATCSDNHLNMTLERISYNYEENRDTGFKLPAEKVIADEYALNKKKTKLVPLYAKFRKKTIDRKDAIFKEIKDRLL